MASVLEGLQKQLNISTQRLNALREAYAIQSDPNLKFTLEQQIVQLETEIAEVKKQIEDAYGISAINSSSLLEQKIRELSINVESKVGELFLVNVDRVPPLNAFWDAFDGHLARQNPFQFHFVLACPTQEPDSFAERMVYELVIEELEEEMDAINYVRRTDSRRVKLEKLPLGRNLRISQREFKKYFVRRFGMNDTGTAFEDYIRTGLPRLEYQYVATVFQINASEWDAELMEAYLQWIIDIFRVENTHDEVPAFLFFFAINLRDAHVNPLPARQKKVVESVQDIINSNQERCTLINQLTPIAEEWVADWIRDLGEQNESKIQDLVKLIIAGLPEEKQSKYQQSKLLDMTDIERFQEIVYKVAIG